MEKSAKKNLILFLVIIAVIVGGYLFYNSRNTDTLATPVKKTKVSIGSDLLALLLELQKIELDDSLFKDKVFISLKDFVVPLREQPVGRKNPFAPQGFEVVSTGGNTATSTSGLNR